MKIFAIIVTYNPDILLFKKCVESILSQVDTVVIVNNGESCVFDSLKNDMAEKKIHVIELGKNMGIAYAQNCGIEYAKNNYADFVLFSDQDTVYPTDFVEKSIETCDNYKMEKVAAVVPLFFNENKKQYSQINIEKTKAIAPEIDKVYFVSHAISSGTFSPISIFENVGGMNEELFIDWVDYEWCWRAVNSGYKIICDTKNIINHNMGDSYKTILGRKIVVYSSFRNYFFFRNGVYLLIHTNLFSLRERLAFFKFMIIKSFLFFLTNGVSYSNVRLYCKAVFNGIRKKLSKINDQE